MTVGDLDTAQWMPARLASSRYSGNGLFKSARIILGSFVNNPG